MAMITLYYEYIHFLKMGFMYDICTDSTSWPAADAWRVAGLCGIDLSSLPRCLRAQFISSHFSCELYWYGTVQKNSDMMSEQEHWVLWLAENVFRTWWFDPVNCNCELRYIRSLALVSRTETR